jgi:hypothetical protein
MLLGRDHLFQKEMPGMKYEKALRSFSSQA